jgi:hypothetical protein
VRTTSAVRVQSSDITGEAARLTLAVLQKEELQDRARHYADFTRAAEAVWEQLMGNEDCRAMGNFMLQTMAKSPIQVRAVAANSFRCVRVYVDSQSRLHVEM